MKKPSLFKKKTEKSVDENQLKWDKRWLEVARLVGSWSKDPGSKIGAVIVGEKGQIVSQGYNGFPRLLPDDPALLGDREEKLKRTIHAELNSIFNSIYNNASPAGCTIYVSGLPVCHVCADYVIQAGIKRVVMDTRPDGSSRWKESGGLALEKFEMAGIDVSFVEFTNGENDDKNCSC